MNAPQDFDRRLSGWMADGPSRAPERTVAAALDHARSHPRRRDPLAALRRDPMGSAGFGTGLRVLPLVAALGLLLVAALAVATVGGVFDNRPVIVPPAVPTATPSAAPSSGPSATPTGPSVTPSGPPLPATFHADLIVAAGNPATIDIFDDSGRLVTAASGTPGDGASVDSGVVAVANDPSDPNTVVLTWTGTPCDTTHTLNISQDARTMALERPACSGDLLPLDRILRLTFDGPVPAATITATITTVGG